MDQIIELASDVLLGAGAIGAAVYCIVLARRLKRFSTLETGVGGAVAVLSAQVDDMTRTLDAARLAAGESSRTLTTLTDRAEASARKLELMMASLHDLPDAPSEPGATAKTESAQDIAWRAESAGVTPLFASRRLPAQEAVG
jgi:hypothetical protein